jgi:hypothetical protein
MNAETPTMGNRPMAFGAQKCPTRRRLNAVSIAKMTVAMIESACTAEELVQATGLHLKTIQSYVLTLHREHGCYIESWDEDAAGRQTIARYMIGQKPDAKRPRRPSGERARAYRARKAQERTLLAIQGRLS